MFVKVNSLAPSILSLFTFDLVGNGHGNNLGELRGPTSENFENS